VASYFCTPDGQVLHVLAGPVSSNVLLREARWVVETWKLAVMEHQAGAREQAGFLFRKAHADRLRYEHGLSVNTLPPRWHGASGRELAALLSEPVGRNLSRPGRIHLLFALTSQLQIGQLYRVIFESVLDEKVSTNPITQRVD
jgi:hypothetical protein